MKGQHRTAVGDRIQAKFLRVQHPHELRQHALDFVQCLRAILSRRLSHQFHCDKSRTCYAISFSPFENLAGTNGAAPELLICGRTCRLGVSA